MITIEFYICVSKNDFIDRTVARQKVILGAFQSKHDITALTASAAVLPIETIRLLLKSSVYQNVGMNFNTGVLIEPRLIAAIKYVLSKHIHLDDSLFIRMNDEKRVARFLERNKGKYAYFVSRRIQNNGLE